MMFYPVIIENTKDWVDYMSALGPTIAAFIAVGVAFWQGKIQKKQHNLTMLEKRLDFWKDVKSLGNNVFRYQNISFNNIINDPEKRSILPEIQQLENKGKVLFGESVERKLIQLEGLFISLRKEIDDLEDIKGCMENISTEEFKDEYSSKEKCINEKKEDEEKGWIDLAVLIFEKIRELKV